ncbi:MAG: hypothetical protein JSR72_23305 [Proteobacteria bacterium]|nr:hypothetical protein [Pseudomonadota bacterium]
MTADASITAGSIIDDLGGTGAVAKALSCADSTVSSWRARGVIPGPNWAGIVALAAEQGRSEITFEVLARLGARRLSEARA